MKALTLAILSVFSISSWAGGPKCGKDLTSITQRLQSAQEQIQDLQSLVKSRLKLAKALPELVPAYAVREFTAIGARLGDLDTAVGIMHEHGSDADVLNLESAISALDVRVQNLSRVEDLSETREWPRGHRAREIETRWPGDLDWLN